MERVRKQRKVKARGSDAYRGVSLRRSGRLRKNRNRYGAESEHREEVITIVGDESSLSEMDDDFVNDEDQETVAVRSEEQENVVVGRDSEENVPGGRVEQDTVAAGREDEQNVATAELFSEAAEEGFVELGLRMDAVDLPIIGGRDPQENVAEREAEETVASGHDTEGTVAGGREEQDTLAEGREEEENFATADIFLGAAEREEEENLAALRRRLDAMGLPETGRLSRWKIIMMEVARELRGSTVKVTRTERNRMAKARWESLSYLEKQVYEEKAKEMNARAVRPPRIRKPTSGGRPKGHLRSGCSPKRVQALKAHLKTCADKWDAVSQKGFLGLISMKATSLREKEFLITVLRRYDPETSMMKIDEDKCVEVTPADVTRVLGIPNGPNPLPDMDAVPKAEYERYKEKYLGLKFRDLLRSIETTEASDKSFGEMVILYLLCVYLTPTTMGRVSEKVLHLAWCWGDSSNYSWAESVLGELKASLRSWKQSERAKGQVENGKRRRKKKKKEPQDPSFRGCVHFLLIFYFDKKKMGVKLDPHAHPIGQWTNGAISERIHLEKAALAEKKMLNTAEPSRKKPKKDGSFQMVQKFAIAVCKAANTGRTSGSIPNKGGVCCRKCGNCKFRCEGCGHKEVLNSPQRSDREEEDEVQGSGPEEEDDEDASEEDEDEEETEYSSKEEEIVGSSSE